MIKQITIFIHVEETAHEFGWKGMKNNILFGGSLRMSDPLEGRWMDEVICIRTAGCHQIYKKKYLTPRGNNWREHRSCQG